MQNTLRIKKLSVVMLTAMVLTSGLAMLLEPTNQSGTSEEVSKIRALGEEQDHPGTFVSDEHTVFLYHFDETDGGIAEDETGSYDGTIYGDAAWVPGRWGNALKFDGIDDYVDTNWYPHIAHDGDFTVEFWLKTNNTERYYGMPLFGVNDATYNHHPRLWGSMVSRAHNEYPLVYAEYSDETNYVKTVRAREIIDDYRWHYFAFVREDGVLSLHLDGIMYDSVVDYCDDDYYADYSFLIGDDQFYPVTNYEGVMDEFRVSRIAREITPLLTVSTDKEIYSPGNEIQITTEYFDVGDIDLEIIDPEGNILFEDTTKFQWGSPQMVDDNTVAFWSFEEENPYVAVDESTNHNDGSINGNQYTDGLFNTALDFNGSDNYIIVSESTDLDGFDSFTVDFWMKPDVDLDINTPRMDLLYKKRTSGLTCSYFLSYGDASGELVWGVYSSYYEPGPGVDNRVLVYVERDFNADQWYHIACTFDKDEGSSVLINGVEEGTVLNNIHGQPMINTGYDLWIGARPDNNFHFDGTLDEIRISDCVRSVSEFGLRHYSWNSYTLPNTARSGDYIVRAFNVSDGLSSEVSIFVNIHVADDGWIRVHQGNPPSGRCNHPMAYDSDTNQAIVFAGHAGGNNRPGETWNYHLDVNQWENVNTPPELTGRDGHAMEYVQSTGEAILFGGWDGQFKSDTWGYDFSSESWELKSNNGPSPRSEIAMAYSSNDDVVVLFGGADASGTILDDTWVYSPSSESWTQTDSIKGPSPRICHAMAYDSTNDLIVLFGGRLNDWSQDDETWTYDIGTETWKNRSPDNSPPARENHDLVYDAENNVVILFGGYDGGRFNDTWIYDVSLNKWTELLFENNPEARDSLAMEYDSRNGQIILFGGKDKGEQFLSDTWILPLGDGIYTKTQWVVDDDDGRWTDFNKVQDAVDFAKDGDTIYVYSGEYTENIVLDKQLSVIGNGSSETVIDGNEDGTVLLIDADKCIISGLNITNSGISEGQYGIMVRGNDNIITECAVSKGYHGIITVYAWRNQFFDNIIWYNKWQGLLFHPGYENIVTDNTFLKNGLYGVACTSTSWGNEIHHNVFIENGGLTAQCVDNGNNKWDDGSEGNFWSDYAGPDADGDGIGDIPYDLEGDGERSDNYPLMGYGSYSFKTIEYRIAGKPGNIVSFSVTMDRIETDITSLMRTTGAPDVTSFRFYIDSRATIDLTFQFTACEGNTDTPVWIIIDGKKVKVTTFEATDDPDTWYQEYQIPQDLVNRLMD